MQKAIRKAFCFAAKSKMAASSIFYKNIELGNVFK